MIPKRAYLYWGGTPLSYLRYLTVESLSRLNPDWEIQVHVGDHNADPLWKTGEHRDGYYVGDDHLHECSALPNVTLHRVNDIRYKGLHPVMVSDCLRWELLRDGGFWSDFDIIHTQPLEEAIREFSSPDGAVTLHHYDRGKISCFYVYIGTIFSTGGALARAICDCIYAEAMAKVSNEKYQAAGSGIVTDMAIRKVFGLCTEEPEGYYPTTGGANVYWLFQTRCPLDRFPEWGRHGVHWYGGHPDTRMWENLITPETIEKHKNRYLIRRTECISTHS